MNSVNIEVIVINPLDRIKEILIQSSHTLSPTTVSRLEEILISCYDTNFEIPDDKKSQKRRHVKLVPIKPIIEPAQDFLDLLQIVRERTKKTVWNTHVEIYVTFAHATEAEILLERTKCLLQRYAEYIHALEGAREELKNNTIHPLDELQLQDIDDAISFCKNQACVIEKFLEQLI